MWLFYSLLTAVLIGVGQVFTKKGLSHTTPLFNNLISIIIVPAIMIPFALLHGVNYQQLTAIYPFVILIALSFLCYYYVLEMGQVSLTGSIIAIYPIFTVILSFQFLHESPGVWQKIAIAMVLIGSLLIGLPKNFYKEKVHIGAWFWWAIFTAIITGFADFLAKIQIGKSDIYTYSFAFALAWLPVVMISVFFDKKGRKFSQFTFKKYLPTIIGVIMLETSFLFFNIALSLGYASLVSPVSSLYVGITLILAWIFLKEKITLLQLSGIIISFLGIVLVSF